MNQNLNHLLCSYCNTPFKSISGNTLFGVISCQCDQYPIVNGVIFLEKRDSLIHKRVIEVMDKNKLSVVWTSLSDERLKYRLTLTLLYFLKNRLNPAFLKLSLVISFLSFISTKNEKKWFQYVSETQIRQKKLTSFLKSKSKMKKVVSIGCGMGHLEKSISNNKVEIIAFDKSMVSLTIAAIFNHGPTYICSDVEQGLPLKQNTADQILIIDTFAWIKNKLRLLSEANRILKRESLLLLINIHEQNKKTKFWGYGIQAKLLFLISKELFEDVYFLSNKFTKISKSKINKDSYSLLFLNAK